MSGLNKLCKLYGSIEFVKDGKTTIYVWDYANDIPRVKGEMTSEELAASEKRKYELLKQSLTNKS